AGGLRRGRPIDSSVPSLFHPVRLSRAQRAGAFLSRPMPSRRSLTTRLHSSTCLSASSLRMPYRSTILPTSRSRFPSSVRKSSSVIFPHFDRTSPLSCIHLVSINFQFIAFLLRLPPKHDERRTQASYSRDVGLLTS